VLLCPKCAAQIEQGALICPVCRQPVGQVEEARFADTPSAEERVSDSAEDFSEARTAKPRVIAIGNVRISWRREGAELGCVVSIYIGLIVAVPMMAAGLAFLSDPMDLLIFLFVMGLFGAAAGGCIGVVLEGIVNMVRWFFDTKPRKISSHFIESPPPLEQHFIAEDQLQAVRPDCSKRNPPPLHTDTDVQPKD
jgi:hypothetical protein